MNCDHAGLVEGLTRKQQQYLRRGRRMASLFPKGSRFFSHVNRVVVGLTRRRIGAEMLGVPIGLPTTTGRNSGRARTVPIVYLDEGTHFLVAPANSGLDVPPAWYLNLRAQPTAKVCTRTGTDRVVARELSGYGSTGPGSGSPCTIRYWAAISRAPHVQSPSPPLNDNRISRRRPPESEVQNVQSMIRIGTRTIRLISVCLIKSAFAGQPWREAGRSCITIWMGTGSNRWRRVLTTSMASTRRSTSLATLRPRTQRRPISSRERSGPGPIFQRDNRLRRTRFRPPDRLVQPGLSRLFFAVLSVWNRAASNRSFGLGGQLKPRGYGDVSACNRPLAARPRDVCSRAG